MAEAAVATPAGAGASTSAGSPGGISTITNPGSPNIGAGAGSNKTDAGQGGSHEAGGQGAAAKPSKFSFDLGDGSGPTEIDFEGEGGEAGDKGGANTEFKFADLDAIKDTHPDLFKSLKAEISKAQRFGKVGLKSPEEFKAVNERINRISNGAGLDGIEQTMSHMASELQGFRSGNVENWAKESPEEFGFAASKIADEWGKHDPKGYVGHVAKAAMYAMLQKDSYGQSALDAFNAAYAATTDPNTKKLLDRVAHTLDAINQNSQYQPDVTAVRQRQLDQRETAVWNQKVDLETGSLIRPALSKALSQAAEQLGLDIDADDRSSYMADMEKQWYEAAKKDTKFLRSLNEANKTKNLQEIQSLVKTNRQAFAVEALKSLYRSKLSKMKGKLREEAGSKSEAGRGGSQSANTIPWTGKMDTRTGSPEADFDFARMKEEDPDMLWNHQFYVKGRKEKFSY